jgi:hypothetical protein
VRNATHTAAATRHETKRDGDVEHPEEDGDAEEKDRPK